MDYNETDEIAAMRNALLEPPAEYDDDQLTNLLDIIWDWQEENGFLEIDAEVDEDLSDEDIINLAEHCRHLLRCDKGNAIRPEDVEPMVRAALAYESRL